MSRLVLRHAWESERPALSAGVQDRSDAAVVALDEREEQLGAGAGAAGEWCASG
ncbi:hypothetical protein Ae263Ps1_6302c [Pseudonocardia sp. Ae263_Ps1]|nr:hypothetical protein Ae263Ps1_6302c [Pseudonocardia sp. Ae263_Ps1]OLL89219.1 hypothetical protein Ae356Ps1_6138 [Pseudonocardia sp. Ae356_Ps1]